MNEICRLHTEQFEQWHQQARESRFADPAETERRERDAELAGGKIGIELAVHLREELAAQTVLRGEGLHARLPQLDETELGGHEETVEGNEQQRADEGEYLNQDRGLRGGEAVSIRGTSKTDRISRRVDTARLLPDATESKGRPFRRFASGP